MLKIPFFCLESRNLICSVSQPLIARLEPNFRKEFPIIGGQAIEIELKVRSLRLES